MKPSTLLKPAIALLAGLGSILHAQAGIPVVDSLNVGLNEITSAQSMLQTAKQVDEYIRQGLQYQTALDQYANMVQNTTAPVTQIWGQAQDTIKKLTAATDTLNYYKQQAGSLNDYLSKFQDLDYYRNSPCFTAAGCSDADRAALQQVQKLASQSQKKANDAIFEGLEQQQRNIQLDSDKLQQLQMDAEGAKGQLQAIGYANQLASQQANQLMQIRSLLMTQQNALVAQQQAAVNKEAMQEAASERFWKISAPDTSLDEGFKP